MLNFKKPTIEDRPWLQRLYACSGFRGAEYTFANLYMWSYFYGEVTEYRNHLCQRLDFQGLHQYIYPAGCGDKKPVLDALWQDSHDRGHPFVVRSLTKETMADLEAMYPGKFTYEDNRMAWDYLYEIETLAELKGIKTVNKRIGIISWNKEEDPRKGEYKKYKMTVNDMGNVFFKPYHILEIERDGQSFGLYFPCYELEVLEELTGLRAEGIENK